MVEKEFFIEWMQKLYKRFDKTDERVDAVAEEQRLMREEMSIIREQTANNMMDHTTLHMRLDSQQKEIDRIKQHLGIDKTEH